MKFHLRSGPVKLIERPEFIAGFVFGFSSPVCVVQMQLASAIDSAIVKSEKILLSLLGNPESIEDGNNHHFRRAANKIAFWYAEAQNRNGLIIKNEMRIERISIQKGVGATLTLLLPYRFAEASLASLTLVINTINDISNGFYDIEKNGSEISFLKNVITKYREKGQNVHHLLNAAIAKGIPFSRIENQLYQFGIGAAQCILESTFTEKTSNIGAKLARNKITTSKVLALNGLPGGMPIRVQSPEEAIDAAKKLGYPVVIKPVDSDGGHGVSSGLCNPEDIKNSFQLARRVSPNVMIDQHVEGTGHRLTIIFGEIVKVTAKKPWGVLGDGVATIAELVKNQNKNQVTANLSNQESGLLNELDDEALSLIKQAKRHPGSVLEKDNFLALRRRNNANAGGSTELLSLEKVHEDNLALALRIADIFMLDVAGVDLIIPDISQSWITQKCLICDVNSQPQVGPKTAAYFLEKVMPGTGRIPVTLVLIPSDQNPVFFERIRQLLKPLGVDGIASSDGIWIREKQVGRAGLTAYHASRILFSQRDVFNAAIVMAVDDLNTYGLPCDAFNRMAIVYANKKSPNELALETYVAGEVSRQKIEQDIFQFGFAKTTTQVPPLLEKIWPHFVDKS